MQNRPVEKWLTIAQAAAALALAVAFFLPFYRSLTDEVSRLDEWALFMWAIPVVFILYSITNRWLKAILCLLCSLGGGAALVLLTFAATFKRYPLTGFFVARAAVIVLILCWLVLMVVTLVKRT